MREIPDLQIVCLRAVGSHQSSAEVTFAKGENGEISMASRLLRSFHLRDNAISYDDSNCGSSNLLSIQNVPILPRPCIGPGSSRRINANEVDINHPFIGCRETIPNGNAPSRAFFIQYGNPALDYLQSYIDTLVDLGRMDDRRLGIHFFQEWKTNVVLADRASPSFSDTSMLSKAIPKKRRRSGVESSVVSDATSLPLGSLSLYNCTIADETVECMISSGMCLHLAVLDLTGLRGLTDDLAIQIFRASPNIQRLSLKNCRKITGKSVVQLISMKKLHCLDVGGCFNISSSEIVDIIPSLPALSELHASGLLWNDASLQSLVACRDTWKGLSLGFSNDMTQSALRECLLQLGDSMQSLALPFCESVVDNALLGVLGRNMPMLQFLDLRGNGSLNTITGFFDGRTSADLPAQALTVVGRYSGLTDISIEETRRVHPLHASSSLLTVYLDEKGMGAAITRTDKVT